MTTYSPEQIVSRATAAGRTAYAAVILAGRAAALADRAYNQAYIRTIPPCWVTLLPPPTPPRLAPLKGLAEVAETPPDQRTLIRRRPKLPGETQ